MSQLQDGDVYIYTKLSETGANHRTPCSHECVMLRGSQLHFCKKLFRELFEAAMVDLVFRESLRGAR